MRKIKNSKGFTLMEMLIVVAIIAVLVAIAIPTFNNSLVKAKEATDLANIRAAYAEYQIKMMLDDKALPTSQNDVIRADDVIFDDKLTWEESTKTLKYTPTNGEAQTWTFKDPSIG